MIYRYLPASSLAGAGTYSPTRTPHFLWIVEFPLFTRADAEKDLLAKGRWSSTHHPFTAPAWQDVHALFDGRISEVSTYVRGRSRNH
jgi:aspartyl-tRNA synthetase